MKILPLILLVALTYCQASEFKEEKKRSFQIHNMEIVLHPTEAHRLNQTEEEFLKYITPAEQAAIYGGELSFIDTSFLEGTAVHNPSLIKYKGKKYMTLRVHKPIHNPPYYVETTFAEVDENYKIISHHPLVKLPDTSLEIKLVPFFEDARLTLFQDRLYASFVGDISYQEGPPNWNYYYRCCMNISSLEPGTPISTHLRPNIDNNASKDAVQKNWLFFEKDSQFLIMTMLDPMVIFDATDTLEAPKKLVEKIKVIKDWHFGEIRASTTPLYLEEYKKYLSFYHSHILTKDTSAVRQYFLGALLFDENFNITDYTKLPLFVSTPHIKRHLHANTILPYGCILDGSNLILSVGINDKEAAIMKLPLSKVMENITPLN